MLDKLDVYLIAGTAFTISAAFAFVMLWFNRFPSVATLTGIAALFNTRGGIVMSLWLAWVVTLFLTLGFGVWVIVRGVDPQHTVVTIVMGMLISQAFGNVNGALFKTMTGEDPKPPVIQEKTETTTSTSTELKDPTTTTQVKTSTGRAIT